VAARTHNVTLSLHDALPISYSADCAGTIANGETKYCTVTNNDQAATLVVCKHVINDNGGQAKAGDFTLDSGGSNDSPDNFPGVEPSDTGSAEDTGALQSLATS